MDLAAALVVALAVAFTATLAFVLVAALVTTSSTGLPAAWPMGLAVSVLY